MLIPRLLLIVGDNNRTLGVIACFQAPLFIQSVLSQVVSTYSVVCVEDRTDLDRHLTCKSTPVSIVSPDDIKYAHYTTTVGPIRRQRLLKHNYKCDPKLSCTWGWFTALLLQFTDSEAPVFVLVDVYLCISGWKYLQR